jgi:glycosyltransferase involved in cell wall biosynthesis
MNIFFFEDSSKSLFGGGQKISSFVLEILNNTSFNVIYCDFKQNSMLREKLNLSRNKSIVLLHNSINLHFSFFFDFLFFGLNFLRLVFLFFSHRQDIIYAPTKRSLVYAFLLYRLFKVPYLYHAHMILQDNWYDFLYIYILKQARFCICVSEFVKEEFQKKGLTNTILICNPLENDVIEKKKKTVDNKFLIAYFGTINKTKGVNYLLESVKFLKNFEFKVSIFGVGDELEKLKTEFGFECNVFFEGFVKDVIHRLDDVDVLVLPTIIPEAAPTIIQQAMSRGIPVITTNIGGQKYFVRDKLNGILVDPKSPEQIANAILMLKNNKQFFDFVSVNNSNHAKFFKTINDFKKDVLNLFDYENSSTWKSLSSS